MYSTNAQTKVHHIKTVRILDNKEQCTDIIFVYKNTCCMYIRRPFTYRIHSMTHWFSKQEKVKVFTTTVFSLFQSTIAIKTHRHNKSFL